MRCCGCVLRYFRKKISKVKRTLCLNGNVIGSAGTAILFNICFLGVTTTIPSSTLYGVTFSPAVCLRYSSSRWIDISTMCIPMLHISTIIVIVIVDVRKLNFVIGNTSQIGCFESQSVFAVAAFFHFITGKCVPCLVVRTSVQVNIQIVQIPSSVVRIVDNSNIIWCRGSDFCRIWCAGIGNLCVEFVIRVITIPESVSTIVDIVPCCVMVFVYFCVSQIVIHTDSDRQYFSCVATCYIAETVMAVCVIWLSHIFTGRRLSSNDTVILCWSMNNKPCSQAVKHLHKCQTEHQKRHKKWQHTHLWCDSCSDPCSHDEFLSFIKVNYWSGISLNIGTSRSSTRNRVQIKRAFAVCPTVQHLN